MVLKENPPPIVENQRLRKNIKNNLVLDSSLEIIPSVIFPDGAKFFTEQSAPKKIKLHTNGANRRRVLKGEKLAVRGQGISTTLSTFMLKS